MVIERGPLAVLADDYVDRLTCALATVSRESLTEFGNILARAYDAGKQVFTLGNGGSASLASHMAADLTKNTIGPNMRRFRVTSLSDNASIVTALGNDLGYDRIFSEQLSNVIRAGDVLLVVSASGNSPNVLRAMEYARSQSAQVIGLLGFDGGRAAQLADVAIVVDSRDYGVVEDVHSVINHMLVEHFKAKLAEARLAVV